MRLIGSNWAGALAVVAAAAALSAGTAFSANRGVAASHLSPKIVSFSPTSAKTGTVIMIAGTNLKGATSVTLGGLKAKFRVISAHVIIATVPPRARAGKVTVTTKSGKATSQAVFRPS